MRSTRWSTRRRPRNNPPLPAPFTTRLEMRQAHHARVLVWLKTAGRQGPSRLCSTALLHHPSKGICHSYFVKVPLANSRRKGGEPTSTLLHLLVVKGDIKHLKGIKPPGSSPAVANTRD